MCRKKVFSQTAEWERKKRMAGLKLRLVYKFDVINRYLQLPQWHQIFKLMLRLPTFLFDMALPMKTHG
jgi:uncharacterized protein with NAD-binding domain and iron-sulfur cluster